MKGGGMAVNFMDAGGVPEGLPCRLSLFLLKSAVAYERMPEKSGGGASHIDRGFSDIHDTR